MTKRLGEVNRQTRKRLETRQRISDVATRLFFERGFDRVKIEEIAETADVSRMTVFNHFPRKEDMFFDLDEEAREDVLNAIRIRGAEVPPIEAIRLFVHWAISHERPYVQFFNPQSDKFMETLEASEALKARARAIRDELTDLLAGALATSVRRVHPDPIAGLGASLMVATWSVALTEARRSFQQDRNREHANETLLDLVDRGAKGIMAALEGTPYA